MATPYVRAVVTPRELISTASLSVELPADVALGDLMILFAASPTSIPLTSPDWESIDYSDNGLLGPYVQAWKRLAGPNEPGSAVTVRVAKPSIFLMTLFVIADPGLGVTRLARMAGTPSAQLRTTDGFAVGAAYVLAPTGQGVQPASDLRSTAWEGSNGAGLYGSVRYGSAAVGTYVTHGLARPTNYGQAAAGHLLDVVANYEPLGALVKGRSSTGLDWELVG